MFHTLDIGNRLHCRKVRCLQYENLFAIDATVGIKRRTCSHDVTFCYYPGSGILAAVPTPPECAWTLVCMSYINVTLLTLPYDLSVLLLTCATTVLQLYCVPVLTTHYSTAQNSTVRHSYNDFHLKLNRVEDHTLGIE